MMTKIDESIVFSDFDKVLKILLDRKWHLKLGKRREAEQSLLAHSLNAMSVALIFSDILNLNETKTRNLVLASLLHDCAEKESDEWQEYVLGLRNNRPKDQIDRIDDLLSKIKPYLKNPLNKTDEADIKNAVKLHMKWSQKDDALVAAQYNGVSNDFIKILDILRIIDGLVSNTSLSKLIENVKTGRFDKDFVFPLQFKLEFHMINMIRGISTS